jgi:outer membrane protein
MEGVFVKALAQIVFFIINCLWLSPAFGGSTSGPLGLSLEDAIKNALRENPRITAAGWRLEAEDARIGQARSGLLPQLTFREVFGHTTNPVAAFGTKLNQGIITSQDFSPDLLNHPDPINNFASVFSMTWPLYDSGQTLGTLKQARLGKEAAGFDMERVRQQVIARTVLGYNALLVAREKRVLLQSSLETARAHQSMAGSRYRNGLTVKSDLLSAGVRVLVIEQQLLQAESEEAVAMARLNAAMGTPVEQIIEPWSPLRTPDREKGSLETWLDTAMLNRPELKKLDLKRDIVQAEITKARAAHLPSLSLVANYENNTEEFGETADNYSLGAVVSIDIFSGGRLTAKKREASAALGEVLALRKEMEQGIRVETRRAYLMAQAAEKQIEAAQAAVEQAAEALRIVRSRYETGLVAIVTLLDAEIALQESQTLRLGAIHDYNAALAELSLAAGTIGEHFPY